MPREPYHEETMKYRLILSFLISLFSSAAFACDIPYSEFEEAIPHIDIVSCPNNIGISEDAGFCRLVLNGQDAYVYGFKFTEDEACLSQVRKTSLSKYLLK